MHRSTWSSSATPWMTSQQGETFGHHPRLNSWFLGIGRSDPVVEVSPSPHHSCGIYFLPTSDFSTMNINFSGRDLKLIICNSLFCATEDLCHQCELYYYYYYYYYWRIDPMPWRFDPMLWRIDSMPSHGLDINHESWNMTLVNMNIT